jgi:hypothetical protein
VKGSVVKLTALLSLCLLVLPFAAKADENLVAKREACRQEARMRIFPVGKIGVDEYRRVVERRSAHVTQCMTRTGIALKDLPVPPKRDLQSSPGSVRSEAQVLKEPARLVRSAQRVERRKPKISFAKMHKEPKAKARKLGRLRSRSR